MQKVAYILLINLIITGCSVSRNSLRSPSGESVLEREGGLVNFLKTQNLTSEGFYIQKALIEVNNGESKDSFIANCKFLPPDTFLISIRGKSGIEAARIFITRDTVLVNDRLNRELLYGRPESFGRKYGIQTESFPLLVGDYVGESRTGEEKINCIDNVFNLEGIIHGLKMEYVIDCKRGKIVSATREGSTNQSHSQIEYDKFVPLNGLYYPSEIHLNIKGLDINIDIQKIESPWNGNVEFIPGSKYELKELL